MTSYKKKVDLKRTCTQLVHMALKFYANIVSLMHMLTRTICSIIFWLDRSVICMNYKQESFFLTPFCRPFRRMLGIITKKDVLKHMAQMANRDPDSILFNWRLSGHTPAHTHMHTESSCEDGDGWWWWWWW